MLCFALAAGLTALLIRPGTRLTLLDHPNERSLHEHPTPRTGGIAITAAIAAGAALSAYLYGPPPAALWLASGAVLVAAVSFLDDLSHVPAAPRFAVHVVAAALLCAGGFTLQALVVPGLRWEPPAAVSAALSVIYVAWMVNLYNFMDGMDGFAAGMAVFGFGSFAVLGWLQGDAAFAALSLVIAAAAGGFLCFNFPPARVFMGDIGSSLLGFLAAALSLWAARGGLFPLWVGLLVFSPFVVDATVTLVRRALRRERVWVAHRTHYYQRLVQLGWGHRRTVTREYALMGACSLSAMVAVQAPRLQWVILLAWCAAYTILMATIREFERRAAQGGHDDPNS